MYVEDISPIFMSLVWTPREVYPEIKSRVDPLAMDS